MLTETIGGLVEGELYRWRARVLYAPYSVGQPGITPPPNPAHGPWRRVIAQTVEADIRLVPEPAVMLLVLSGIALRRRHRTAKA